MPVPPRNVRVAVAGVLTIYDPLIESNRRRMALWEESPQLLYRDQAELCKKTSGSCRF